MKSAEAYSDLVRMGSPVVTTREAATRLKTTARNASRALGALQEAGLVRRLRQGLWAVEPDLEPFAVAPYLTAPFPAYVSLFSAMHRHGLIEQIPRQVSVVSLDRAQRIETSIGHFVVHHITPDLFGGYEGSPQQGYLATPEKALFDLVYIRAAAGDRAYLPELSLPDSFDRAQMKQWSERIKSPRLRTLISRRLRDVLRNASRQPSPA